MDRRCTDPQGWQLLECPTGEWWAPRRCRQCRGCRNAWRARQVARIVRAMEGGNWGVAITLTSLPGATWPRLMTAWTRLVARLRRDYGLAGYAAMKEAGHRRGMLHLHILATGVTWIPQGALAALWRHYSGADVVWIARVRRTLDAVRYAAKYVGKGYLETSQLRKSLTASRGFLGHPPPHPVVVKRELSAAVGAVRGLPGEADARGVVVVRACQCGVTGGVDGDATPGVSYCEQGTLWGGGET